MSLQEHLNDLRSSYAAVKAEEEARRKVMESKLYQALQYEMDVLLQHIPNSREEYEMDKAEVLKEMNAQGLLHMEGFQTKTRVKKAVDTYAVLQSLDGDIDSLMLVATVSQKALETFIADNPETKRELRSCIKEVGESVTDIVPETL